MWEQRWKRLSQRVAGFEPGGRERLSFAKTSCPPTPPPRTSPDTHRREHSESGRAQRGGKSGLEDDKSEGRREKKAWYEEPSVIRDSIFDLPYISNLHKTPSTSNHPSVETSANDQPNGESKHRYFTPCVLPAAALCVQPGKRWGVVHVSVRVGRVVVYCGEREGEERGGEVGEGGYGCMDVNRFPVKAVVVYHTDDLYYSITM